LCKGYKIKFYECGIIGTPSIFTYSSSFQNIFNIVKVSLRGKEKKAVVLKEVQKPSFKCLPILETICSLSQTEQNFVKFISYYYFSTISQTLAIFYLRKSGSFHLDKELKTSIILNKPQQQVYNFILEKRVALLFGDTGSGKTEIYIKLIEYYLNQNRTALLLLPEISITSQIEKRLKFHFKEHLIVWHSKISKTQREKNLKLIEEGRVGVVVGARSALFLPLKELGIIIVDEFHDDSYKSQSIPTYNAKDLAIYKAKKENIKVVLGSATPLISDIYKYGYVRLRGNYYQTTKKLSFTSFFDDVIKKIELKLKEKEQIIIFIPTRANFKYMICKSCNRVIKCPYCDVSMSLHTSKRLLKCHYCNYTQPIVTECPECGGGEFLNERLGSSEVVDILKERFPNCNVEKFDKDVITSKSRLEKVLKRFEDKEIDILVGTQMISKGHDYDVGLVAILDIDYLLNMPDYRAREKALSLFIQVSGRAGRRRDAEIIVQTANPQFFMKNYEEFIKEELKFRKEFQYPPFSKIARIEFSDKDRDKAYQKMLEVKECLEREQLEILGFGEAPISKIANRYRYQIVIKGVAIHKQIWRCIDNSVKVDMDALNFG
jgi:primosomal protein N' (replication factor Y)